MERKKFFIEADIAFPDSATLTRVYQIETDHIVRAIEKARQSALSDIKIDDDLEGGTVADVRVISAQDPDSPQGFRTSN